ncbi:MAG: ribonuclease HI family protein [Patescibacteria group bacterium]
MTNRIYINTDGGSRGNPGPAAIGVVFCDEKEGIIHKYKESIGAATNNEAEYTAIIRALDILSKSKWLKENGNDKAEVHCRLDSQLVTEQITGGYRVKQEHLQILNTELKKLINDLKIKIFFHHIPRRENKLADALVNEALDQLKSE